MHSFLRALLFCDLNDNENKQKKSNKNNKMSLTYKSVTYILHTFLN